RVPTSGTRSASNVARKTRSRGATMATGQYQLVSSNSEDTQIQDADLKPHAANKTDAVWYTGGFTGRRLGLHGWSKLWSDVVAGKIDRIVVWRLDQLGRTVSSLSRLFEELQRRKIAFVSLREGLEVKSGRQRAGTEAARAQKQGTRGKITDEVA